MQIIIEIPNSEIPKQQDFIEIPLHFIDGTVCEAGGYGFDVLPKGHGRLIDADALNIRMEQRMNEIGDDESIWESSNVETALDMFAPTIIEADKAESEDEK